MALCLPHADTAWPCLTLTQNRSASFRAATQDPLSSWTRQRSRSSIMALPKNFHPSWAQSVLLRHFEVLCHHTIHCTWNVSQTGPKLIPIVRLVPTFWMKAPSVQGCQKQSMSGIPTLQAKSQGRLQSQSRTLGNGKSTDRHKLESKPGLTSKTLCWNLLKTVDQKCLKNAV